MPAPSVTETLGAGAVAAALTSVGLEPQPLFWALVGAAIGVSMAPKTGPWRAAILFGAVVLGCSLLGSLAAQTWGSGSQIQRNGAACVLAIVFHPLLTAFVGFIPDLLRRFGGGGAPTGDPK